MSTHDFEVIHILQKQLLHKKKNHTKALKKKKKLKEALQIYSINKTAAPKLASRPFQKDFVSEELENFKLRRQTRKVKVEVLNASKSRELKNQELEYQ